MIKEESRYLKQFIFLKKLFIRIIIYTTTLREFSHDYYMHKILPGQDEQFVKLDKRNVESSCQTNICYRDSIILTIVIYLSIYTVNKICRLRGKYFKLRCL